MLYCEVRYLPSAVNVVNQISLCSLCGSGPPPPLKHHYNAIDHLPPARKDFSLPLIKSCTYMDFPATAVLVLHLQFYFIFLGTCAAQPAGTGGTRI